MAHEIERLSTADAARRLGVSPSTVRRRIAAGHLVAERHARPQGVRWLVLWEESIQVSERSDVAEEINSSGASASDEPDNVSEEAVEPIAWFWWFVFPAAGAIGVALGHWFS